MMELTKAVATFTVTRLYSDSDECICCPGQHVFGYDMEGARDWLHEQATLIPHGTRVVITIEPAEEWANEHK